MTKTPIQIGPEELQLKHRILGRLPSLFVQNLVIQAMQESVSLAFYETIPPPKPNPTAEELEQLKETGLLAECIVRLMMPPSAFLEAADAMGRVAKAIREAAQKEELNRDAELQPNETIS